MLELDPVLKPIYIFLSLFLVSIAVKTSAQSMVLDRPFLYTKQFKFKPEPQKFLDALEWLDARNQIKPSKYKLLTDEPLYLRSHLYAEPEKARISVYRKVDFKTNIQFHAVNKTEYIKNNEGDLWCGQSDNCISKKDLKIHPTHWLNMHHNLNLDSLYQTSDYANQQSRFYHFRKLIKESIDINACFVDSLGKLNVREVFYPDSFSLINFTDLIFKSIIMDGNITAYKDLNYSGIFSYTDIEQLYDSLLKKTTKQILLAVKGLRIKEDYFKDFKTGKLTSRIIGIGIIGENQNLGKELFWIYYPELLYALTGNYGIYKNQVFDYEYLLDNHIYTSEIEKTEKHGCFKYTNATYDDTQFLVKLDIDLVVKLLNEQQRDTLLLKEKVSYTNADNGITTVLNYAGGKANGEVRQFLLNGTLIAKGNMLDNKSHGKFQFFYSNGEKKAVRYFENGLLNGTQINYWENGSLYSKYKVTFEEIQSLKRFYRNGQLLEQGKFENGIISGNWDYNITFNNTQLEFFKSLTYFDSFVGYDGKNSFKYSVRYKYFLSEDCYDGWCFEHEIIKK